MVLSSSYRLQIADTALKYCILDFIMSQILLCESREETN